MEALISSSELVVSSIEAAWSPVPWDMLWLVDDTWPAAAVSASAPLRTWAMTSRNFSTMDLMPPRMLSAFPSRTEMDSVRSPAATRRAISMASEGSPPTWRTTPRLIRKLSTPPSTMATPIRPTSRPVLALTFAERALAFSSPIRCWVSMSRPSAATALAAGGLVS